MKTRTGYVSNSSSSSFCVAGIVAGGESLADEFDGYDAEKYGDDKYDFFESVCGKEGLYFHRGIENYSDEDWIVGMSVELMKDDQTMGDFKKQAFEALKRAGWKGADPGEVKIHMDGGFEG